MAINAQEAQIRQRAKQIAQQHEVEFDAVRREFETGTLLPKIKSLGRCDYVFQWTGVERQSRCERESGHKGIHVFGVARELR